MIHAAPPPGPLELVTLAAACVLAVLALVLLFGG